MTLKKAFNNRGNNRPRLKKNFTCEQTFYFHSNCFGVKIVAKASQNTDVTGLNMVKAQCFQQESLWLVRESADDHLLSGDYDRFHHAPRSDVTSAASHL